jgi:translation initiation factor IF-1
MRVPILLALFSVLSFAQDAREIVLRSLELDSQNERLARSYTFVEREQVQMFDGRGRVKRTRIQTYDVTLVEGSPYRRLIARDDKPLSPKEEKKQEEKLRKSIEKRQKETPEQRAKRIAEWEKKRRENHEPLLEIPDAFDLCLAGEEQIDGRDAWIIDATPHPGYRPKSRMARMFTKFKGRIWIDKRDSVWVKAEAEALDTISFGWFLARLRTGARLSFEQTRVNDEVWLPKHAQASLSGRAALLVSFNAAVDVTYSNFRKFQANSRLVSFEPPK